MSPALETRTPTVFDRVGDFVSKGEVGDVCTTVATGPEEVETSILVKRIGPQAVQVRILTTSLVAPVRESVDYVYRDAVATAQIVGLAFPYAYGVCERYTTRTGPIARAEHSIEKITAHHHAFVSANR